MDDLRIKKQKENKIILENMQVYANEVREAHGYMTPQEVLQHKTYSFIERENPLERHFGSGGEIQRESGPAYADMAVQRQDARNLSKLQKRVVNQEKRLLRAKERVVTARRQLDEGYKATDSLTEEIGFYKERLRLIDKQADLDARSIQNDADKLLLEKNKCDAIVGAVTELVQAIPLEHPLRAQYLQEKENAELNLYWANWKLKASRMTGHEKKHEETQISHKQIESKLQYVFSKKDDNCREDAIIHVYINGKDRTLINTGRAFMGGSKPMYYFEDMQTGKRYLYKKAENCCGLSNTKGAVMTEIGATIQHLLDPDSEIQAVAVKNSQGEYVGSIQEMVEKKEDGFDFNSWQHQSDEQRDLSVFTVDVKKQIMKFHCIDWLLCNFDTKGENLMQRPDGSFVSYDKEGAMSHILDPRAKVMSTNYTPHTDEPIYNVFFRLVQQGKVTLEPEVLEELDGMIEKVEEFSDAHYMEIFEPYVMTRSESKRQAVREAILERKVNLRSSYQAFLAKIIK